MPVNDVASQHQSVREWLSDANNSPEVAEISRKKASPAAPVVYLSAPAAFQRAGYSLDRLRHAWDVTPREALESVLAGLVEAVIGPKAKPGRKSVVEMRRAA